MKTITLKEQIERSIKESCELLLGLDFNEEMADVLKSKEAIDSIHAKTVNFYKMLKEAGKISNYIVNLDKSISYEK